MRNAFRILGGEGLVLTSESDVVLRHASRELAVGTDPREPATVLDILAHSQEELTGLDRVRQSFAKVHVGEPVLVVDTGRELRFYPARHHRLLRHAQRKAMP